MKYSKTLIINPKEASILHSGLKLYLRSTEDKIANLSISREKECMQRQRCKIVNMLSIMEDIVNNKKGDLSKADKIPKAISPEVNFRTNNNGFSDSVKAECREYIRRGCLVEVIWTTELGEEQYAVQVSETDFWLRAFKTKKRAEKYCRLLNLKIVD